MGKQTKSRETEFHSWIKECVENNKTSELNKMLKHIHIEGLEVPLSDPMSVMTRDMDMTKRNPKNIGRIDIVFRYKQTSYVAEIKDYDPGQSSFWYAAKALCYCEYLKWQTDSDRFKPAVIIPADSIRLEHQIVAGRLGLAIFLFNKVDDGFRMRMIDDRPWWKQTQ